MGVEGCWLYRVYLKPKITYILLRTHIKKSYSGTRNKVGSFGPRQSLGFGL